MNKQDEDYLQYKSLCTELGYKPLGRWDLDNILDGSGNPSDLEGNWYAHWMSIDGVKFRVHLCEDSGTKVLQELMADGSWLCLHSEYLDEDDILFFERYNSVLYKDKNGLVEGAVDLKGNKLDCAVIYVKHFGYKLYTAN